MSSDADYGFISNNWASNLERDLRKLSEIVGAPIAKTEKLIPGERRDVAILFLDLTDYTSMSESMDHEMVHRIFGIIMQSLSTIVERHGGYVNRIEGDAILALFGAKEATENDCARAVSCGLKMMDVINQADKIFLGQGLTLAARCGINYGSVTVAPDATGSLAISGDEANLASRMESTAEVNTIQVTSRIKKECEDHFTWMDLGEKKIKGKSEFIHTHRPVGPGSIQLARWERAARVSKSPFVGRNDELNELSYYRDMQFEDINDEDGECGKHILVGIKSDAGVGKSRLIHEFIRKYSPSKGKFILLKGQTLSYAQPSYWLWISLLRDFIGILPSDPNAVEKFDAMVNKYHGLSNHAPFLAELLDLPSDDPILKLLDYQKKQTLTINALTNFISIVTREKSRSIIILEDLHWIDEASKLVLERLIVNCHTNPPLLVLCLFRPEGDRFFLDKVSEICEYRELTLRPLTDKSCKEIIDYVLGSTSTELDKFLLLHAQGNPFFLEEFILDMIESGNMFEIDGRWTLCDDSDKVPIPSSMSGLILSRIDRLPELPKNGLQHSSVIGMEFSLRMYKRLTEILEQSDQAKKVLPELENRGFITAIKGTRELRYLFRHILTCNTAYDTILHHNRVIIHRHIADIIQEMFPHDESTFSEIAHHYKQAEIWDKALEFYDKAGNFYRDSVRYDEALIYFRKALSIAESIHIQEHPQVASSLNSIAEIYLNKGQYEKAEELYQRALSIREKVLGPNATDVATSLNNLGVVYLRMGHYNVAEPLYKRALKISENALGPDHQFVATNLNNLAALYIEQYLYDEAEPLHSRALKIKEKTLGLNHPSVANSLVNLGGIYRAKKDFNRARELNLRALQINEYNYGQHHPQVAVALNNLGKICYDIGDFVNAETYSKKALEISKEVYGGEHPQVAVNLNNLAQLYNVMGKLTEAKLLFERAMDILNKVLPDHPYLEKVKSNYSVLIQNIDRVPAGEGFKEKSQR